MIGLIIFFFVLFIAFLFVLPKSNRKGVLVFAQLILIIIIMILVDAVKKGY